MKPQVQPLSYRHRFLFFYLLAGIFVAVLPFLFLYASGYRLNWGGSSLVSTGGLYIAAERTGAQIFIDDQLVRETRVFRRAFYAQGLESGTHRVYVQKYGHHTWTKELPVYAHLVTEAQAFNLPEVPSVRIISPWQTPAGVAVLTSPSKVLMVASSTSQYLYEPRASTSTLVSNSEFAEIQKQFAEPAKTTVMPKGGASKAAAPAATTTKEWRGVKLFEDKAGEVYASFVGSREQMPYYYCALPFPRWPGATSTVAVRQLTTKAEAKELEDEALEIPLQAVSDDQDCDPTIQIDRANEDITFFDFFPDSIDLLVLASESGAYVVEVDDRAWQNRQPLLLGEGLRFRIAGGSIYAYDGKVIYQIITNENWF